MDGPDYLVTSADSFHGNHHFLVVEVVTLSRVADH